MLPLFSYLEPKLKWLLKVRQACAATALNTSGELLYCNNRGDTHCSQVCPHLGTQVPMRTFFRFLHVFSNLYFKELTCLDKFSKNRFLGPHLCWRRSPLGPHFEQNLVPMALGSSEYFDRNCIWVFVFLCICVFVYLYLCLWTHGKCFIIYHMFYNIAHVRSIWNFVRSCIYVVGYLTSRIAKDFPTM